MSEKEGYIPLQIPNRFDVYTKPIECYGKVIDFNITEDIKKFIIEEIINKEEFQKEYYQNYIEYLNRIMA